MLQQVDHISVHRAFKSAVCTVHTLRAEASSSAAAALARVHSSSNRMIKKFFSALRRHYAFAAIWLHMCLMLGAWSILKV
jgi:hypothetical protein